MKTDELRRALDDIAGDKPEVDTAFENVTGRARRQRNRFRAGLAAVGVVLIAGASVIAAQLGSHDRTVTVVTPTPNTTSFDDLVWTRANTRLDVRRIVAADGKTFAVGSSGDANISELDAHGRVISSQNPQLYIFQPMIAGGVNDLVEADGALIAAGERDSQIWRWPQGAPWWKAATVARPSGLPGDRLGTANIRRLVVSDGAIYAVGTPWFPTNANIRPGADECPISVWTSKEGTDFRLLPGEIMCAGRVDAAAGPNGVVIVTADNATAWTRSGDEWSPHRISNPPAANVIVNAIDGNDDGYVAVGSFQDHPTESTKRLGAIWWSPDGRDWERVATVVSPGSTYKEAQFAAVTHTADGWAAVGSQMHPGDNPALTDATLYTSPDGRHWAANTRDEGVFEQYARAEGVGPTADGLGIFGIAAITGTGESGDPIRSDDVLWMGSPTPPTPALGILQGTMRMVFTGDTYVGGTMIATADNGREITAAINANGRFSQQLPPGSYRVVGHNPMFGNGEYDCVPRARATRARTTVRPNKVTHIELLCSMR